MKDAFKLQRRMSPEPRRPFVNREAELSLVQDKIKIGIQGERMPSVVMCFWGAFGMGKSWLLGELERLHKGGSLSAECTRPTITVRLDLDPTIAPALWQHDQINRELLIREFWKELASQLGAEVPHLGQASADEWAGAFVNQVAAWAAKLATPIILLDTVDTLTALDEQTFFWLEMHVVERLAITDRVLFVFTSRGELQRWRRFQVRRRVDSHRLAPFGANTAGQAVNASQELSKALYQHAWGHPLVTEYLGTALENEGISLKTAKSVEGLVDLQLARYVLREVLEEILKVVPELPARMAKPASVLRWISVELLRSLAKDLDLVEPDRGDAYYRHLIETLQAHHLLYWNSNHKNYEYDTVLRQLLTHFLELDDPMRFRAAHLAAFNFHYDHLSRYPQYLAPYVSELAYHCAMLARCEPMEPSPPKLASWWKQFLAEKAPSRPGPWVELLETLDEDEELRGVLPAQEYRQLCSEAEKRAAGASD
jgi:hypothetical protein